MSGVFYNEHDGTEGREGTVVRCEAHIGIRNGSAYILYFITAYEYEI